MRLSIAMLCALVCPVGSVLMAQPRPPESQLLWQDGAPGAQGSEDIDKPTITPYVVKGERATGTAVIVCPEAATRISPWKRKAATSPPGSTRWA